MTLEYSIKPEIDTTECIFHLGILFRTSKFFSSNMPDSELISAIQMTIQDKRMKEYSFSPIQSFSNYFKRRNSATLKISNLLLPLELDSNIKQSKS